MKDELAPLTDNEYVYRRVLAKDVNEDLPYPVSTAAFHPSCKDTDGISVYRADFTTPSEIDSAGPRSGEYYVVRLRVADIRRKGKMDVVPQPMPPLRGHAVIPQIRDGLKGSEKQARRELQADLSELANHAFALKPRSME